MQSTLAVGAKSNGNAPAPEQTTPHVAFTYSGEVVELTRHARALGNQNLPPSTATVPSELEIAVQREHERRHLVLLENTHAQLRRDQATLRDLEGQLPRTEDLRSLVHQAEASIEREIGADDSLTRLHQEVQRRRRDLRIFRADRGLRRPALYPASRRWHFAGVALIALIEAVLNLGFFAPTSDFGLAGGLLQAAGVAAANAILGALAGFFGVRYLNHNRYGVTLLAGTGLAAYAVIAVGFNLAVARWRDLAAAAIPPNEAVGQLLFNPLNLSFPSAVLLLIGLLASALCVWKGFRGDDPVPGHGHLDRALVTSLAAYESRLGVLRERVLSRASQIGENCDALVRAAAKTLEASESTAAEMSRAAEHCDAGRKHEEDSCEIALRRFRDENCRVRTAPAPSYFSVYPRFESRLDRSFLASIPDRLEAGRRRLEELRTEADRIHAGQRERLALAAERLQILVREQLRRADLGRGDGSELLDAEGDPA